MTSKRPSSVPEQPDPHIGRMFAGRYEVIEKIGEGGMAQVYRARQLAMDRMVALKVLRQERSGKEDTAARRFHREMKATSRIVHPNTVSVFDFGQTDDAQLFLAMELLEGEDLTTRVEQQGRLPLDQALWIARGIAEGLSAAHAQNVVHRDLKPENVMLVDLHGRPDHVKVLDFGIATFAAGADEGDALVTATGVFLGTPSYVSPEQIAGEEVDIRADIYSFGVLLFELVTGQLPFSDAKRPLKVLQMHMTKAPPRPSSVADHEIPRWLDELILRMLAKYPDDRPSTADEVFVIIDQQTSARGEQAAPAAWRPSGRVVAMLLLLALGAALLGVAIGYLGANVGQ